MEKKASEIQSEKGYRRLKVWQKAHSLFMDIYSVTKTFPKEELYGVTSQIRRSSLSVALNIVEGQASNSKKEFLFFLNIANRSLVETEYLLEVTRGLGFIKKGDYETLESKRKELAIVLIAFTKAVRSQL